MIYGITTSAGGALLETSRVDAIANNLANAHTAGFRKDFLSFRERPPEALEGRISTKHLDPLLDRLGGGPLIHRSTWDATNGELDFTRRPLDLAIEGDGFFAVRRGGEVLYTRAGNFMRLNDGRVVTADGRGEVLAGDAEGGGEPLVIPNEIPEDEISVLENGAVMGPGGAEIAVLQRVRFADPRDIEKAGDTEFRAVPGAASRALAAVGKVRQGALEQSTTNPVVEMVEMIAALRAYEANMQMIRFQDATLDRAVNDLGRVAR